MITLLIATLISGYFFGVHWEQKKAGRQLEEQREREREAGLKIAIVNMDEGVSKGESNLQYAAQLLPYAGVEYTLTGLQDARTGVENGFYSAYVVIPPNFSQTVYSINTEPSVSNLTFTISSKISPEKREQAIQNLETLSENLNNNLTKVYLSSILKEFHDVQDVSETILANDDKDAKLLDSIDAGSMIAMVEVPELTQVENDINPLDLTQQYNNGNRLIEDFGSAYQRFLAKGQSDIDKTIEKSNEVNTNMSAFQQAFADANKKLEETTLDTEFESFKQAGGAVQGEMEEVIGIYDTYIDTYNTEVEKTNQGREGLRQILAAYEDAETKYQTMLENYKSKEKPDQSYAFINKEDYIKKLAEQLDSAGVDSAPTGYADFEEYLTEITEAMKEEEYCTVIPQILDCGAPGGGVGADAWPEIKPVKKPFEVSAGGDPALNINEALLAKAGDIMNLAESELAAKYNEKRNGLLADYMAAAEQFAGVGEAAGEVNTEFGNYNLASYVDEQEVNAIKNSMTANNQEVEGKVSEHTGAYEQYVSEVYEVTGKDVTAMQESIAAAEEESEKLLIEGLEEVKASRSENNKLNMALLGELPGKLPYTRIGGVESKEVYDFIAAPVKFQEEIPQESTKTVAEEETKRLTDKVPALIAILGGVVILAVLFRILFRQRTKKYESEF